MLCQAVSGVATAATLGNALEHLAVHAAQQAHHHHDDTSVHLDDAGDDSLHVHLDDANTPAMPTGAPSVPAGRLMREAPVLATGDLPAPIPERLLRPPRSLT